MSDDECSVCDDATLLQNASCHEKDFRWHVLKSLCFITENIAANSGSCDCVTDGSVVDLANGAGLVAGTDGTNYRVLSTDADGNLNVNVLNADEIIVSGEVSVVELPVAAALTDDFANPTTTQVAGMAMLWDGATWDRAPGTSVDGALVNLGANNDVTISGTVTVDVPELPVAAALTDDFANPTTTQVAGMGMLWDGATWDRAPGNSTDGTLVNLGANNDVTIAGTVTVAGTVDVTELAAAAALSDNFSNPTTTQVGAMGMVWDGANWDRAPGTSVDGVLVNLGANNDVTVTGAVTVSGTVDITELPAAAALSENFANPTTTQVGAMAMVWDGANWDRLPGTSTDGALVNLGANNDVTVTGTVAVSAVVPGTGATDLGKAEDAALATGSTGVAVLFKRTDTAAAQTDTDGDASFGAVNSFGANQIDINTDFRATPAKSIAKVNNAAYANTDSAVAVAGTRNTSLAANAAINTYGTLGLGTFSQALATLVYDSNIATASSPVRLEDSAHTTADAGMACLSVNNAGQTITFNSTDGDYTPASVTNKGTTIASLIYDSGLSTALSAVRQEDSIHTSGDAGIPSWGVINTDAATTFGATGDYCPQASTTAGQVFTIPSAVDSTVSACRLEDQAFAASSAVMIGGSVQYAAPTNDVGANADVVPLKSNTLGHLYVDPIVRSTGTPAQPTVTNTTSFTLVASNTSRRYVEIQNNSTANIMINVNNGTLTGIVPTSSNVGFVLIPGQSWSNPPHWCPTAAITCYQTTGGSINTISVLEA